MSLYLVIHTRYSDVQIALYQNQNLIDMLADESKKISKNLIPLLKQIFKRNKISIPQLDFVAAHQGPAPFTSLRVALTAVNALAFGTNLPLIGVNGLEVFLKEYVQDIPCLVLLNAFCQDIYYGVLEPQTMQMKFGYGPVQTILESLARDSKGPLTIIGNGVDLYQTAIKQYFLERARFLEPNPQVASLQSIATAAFIKWNEKNYSNQLMPLYIKEYSSYLALPGQHCQPLQ